MSRLIVTKADFQELAEKRIEEAQILLNLGKWDGAYYLAGYAIELALKSCIIKALMTKDAFPDKKFSDNCYTHDLAKLVEVAGLLDPLKAAIAANATFSKNWRCSKDWSEVSRYHRVEQPEAEQLYDAITDSTHGVLTWIKTQW